MGLDSEVSLNIGVFFAESCAANVFVFFYVLVDRVVIRLCLFLRSLLGATPKFLSAFLFLF